MPEALVSQIRALTGSNGEKGWPVAVRDRVAFPSPREDRVTDAQVAVTFLWTIRDAVIPHLKKDNLAVASNFYTPAGLEGMVRNLLANPHIRYVVMLGAELSAKGKNDGSRTSADALRAFFSKGINAERKVAGFETAAHFDDHIPTELIEKVSKEVTFIDLNTEMEGKPLLEHVARVNELLQTLPKKEPFLEKPQVFGFEEHKGALPFEGGPLLVRGGSIPETWIEIMHTINRYGRKNLMDAGTDRWVKEINDLVAVIHDPQNADLSLNPFLNPLSKEKIEAYQREILSPVLPEGKAYTYGNKLRAYHFPSASHIKNIAQSKGFKDFEFGAGPHTTQNVTFLDDGACEINQVADLIEAAKRNPYSKNLVAVTWHPADELMRKHKSSPCLVMVQAVVQDEALNLTVYFRSHDMAQGWPENAYGCAAIQKEVADALGVPCGILVIVSASAQIYQHYYQQVEEMLEKYRTPKTDFHDAKGNWSIRIQDGKIRAELLHPETQKVLEHFEGKTARDVYVQIGHAARLEGAHALYVGYELGKAERALRDGVPYEQDK